MLEKTPGHPQVRQLGAVFLIYKVWGSQSGWWAPEDWTRLAIAERLLADRLPDASGPPHSMLPQA